MGIILAILLAISAGVSYSAESSLPGDVLYPIKTDLNERIQGWLALSAKAESEHQANLAIRRLEEAEKLKAEGKLNAELKSRRGKFYRKQKLKKKRAPKNLRGNGGGPTPCVDWKVETVAAKDMPSSSI